MSDCFLCGRPVEDERHGPEGHIAMVQTELFSAEEAARVERARAFAERHPVQLAQGRGPGSGKDNWREGWHQRRRRKPAEVST